MTDAADSARLDAILTPGRRLSPRDVLVLSARLERPWQTARRRLAMRATAIVDAAALIPDRRPTVRAKTLATRLERYAEGGWARHRPPGNQLEAAMHRILEINGGSPLGWRTIHDTLLQNSLVAPAKYAPEGVPHADATTDTVPRNATRIRDPVIAGGG